MRIDTSEWGEFRIGDLFDIKKGSRLTKAEMKPGEISYIGASAVNNGCTNYIGNTEHLHPARTITVCYDGSIGESFYHEESFWASDAVNVLYPKFAMNKNTAMFIIPLIRSVGQKYMYTDKWKLEYMLNDEIKLPVKKPDTIRSSLLTNHSENLLDTIDFQYMEQYMSAVLAESEEALQKMEKMGEKRKVETKGWGRFRIEDLFDEVSASRYSKNNILISGETPLISSESSNNGIIGYINNEPSFRLNKNIPFYITFGDHTCAIHMVKEDFCITDNVKVLIPRIRMSEAAALYIVSVWSKSIPHIGYARHWHAAKNAEFQLPIKSSYDYACNIMNVVDLDYMEAYMQNIMSEAERKIDILSAA